MIKLKIGKQHTNFFLGDISLMQIYKFYRFFDFISLLNVKTIHI